MPVFRPAVTRRAEDCSGALGRSAPHLTVDPACSGKKWPRKTTAKLTFLSKIAGIWYSLQLFGDAFLFQTSAFPY